MEKAKTKVEAGPANDHVFVEFKIKSDMKYLGEAQIGIIPMDTAFLSSLVGCILANLKMVMQLASASFLI